MPTYHTRFHRYNRHTGESRISGIVFIIADKFADACTIAETRRAGMADADPDCEYRIIEIDGSRDYRGADCDGGARLWETALELRERVNGETE